MNNPVIYVDPDGHKSIGNLYNEFKTLTTTEKTLSALNLKEASTVLLCAKKADKWTTKFYPYWKDGDVGNAYRHAIWNAFMTQAFWSRTTAKMWADAHEAWPDKTLRGQSWNGFTAYEHRDMDYYNNDMGRKSVQWYEFWISEQTISDRIMNLVNNNKLKVLVK